MGAVSKPRQRNRSKVKAITITVVILIPILCLAVVASIGAWQYNQTMTVRWTFRQVDLAAERYTVEFNGEYAQNTQALLDSGMLTEMPVSPVNGLPMHVMQSGSTDFVGGISYFLVKKTLLDGSIENDEMILVYYHTAPSFFEVAWSWLAYTFHKPYMFDSPFYTYNMDRLYSTDPELIWDGGECGDHMVWLARGLTPEQVRDWLQKELEKWGDGFDMEYPTVEMYKVVDTAVRE